MKKTVTLQETVGQKKIDERLNREMHKDRISEVTLTNSSSWGNRSVDCKFIRFSFKYPSYFPF